MAQAWNPAEAVRHLRRAETERRVTIRPAPDTMVHLTALLPMVHGIAAWAALDRDAKALIGTGQAGDRTRGQLMADTLVERLTGQETATAVPVEIQLVMTRCRPHGNPHHQPDDIGDGPCRGARLDRRSRADPRRRRPGPARPRPSDTGASTSSAFPTNA